ncbi:MAG: SRPBCC family protein [Kofleriaceae bacterium]
MLLIILGAVGAAIALVLVIAATRPKTSRLERGTSIAAPAAIVQALIDDFHQWAQWSPWEKLDPAMTRTHSGAERGVGAIYAWDGNRKAGAGQMEILEVTDGRRVAIKLSFVRPFPASNLTEFTLRDAGGTTEVTWVMTGPSPFIARVMGVFINFDKLVGKDFEAGLAKLKAIAEAAPAQGTAS